MSIGELLAALPVDLEEEARNFILQDFERARSHIYSVYVLKLIFMTRFPHRILAVAHMDHAVRRTALREALESSCQHHFVAELQGDALATMAKAYVDGEDWSAEWLADLRSFISQFRWAKTESRGAEELHAISHKAILRAPHSGPAFVSFSLRLPEITLAIHNHLDMMLHLLKQTRSPPAMRSTSPSPLKSARVSKRAAAGTSRLVRTWS